MTTDLGLLTTAAEKWDKAAKDFESVQKVYDSQVRNIATDGSWTGVASMSAFTASKLTYEQYTAAAKEAGAIASLLRDAHAQFTELRGKLQHEVAQAVEAGMKVSDDGTARFDFEKASKALADAARHDPDLHTTESTYTSNIAHWVQAFDDADQGAKLALAAAAKNSDVLHGGVNGFNAQAEGDIEKVEGRREAELATKLSTTGHLSAVEVAEMKRLFRDNQKSKEFSRTLLDSLGPRGTLLFTNRLNETMEEAGEAAKADFNSIEKGLATSLATATRSPDSAFYGKWREELRKVGTEVVDSRQKVQVKGYQSLVTLMARGGGYSAGFITDLGDDIIAAEKGHPGVWDMPSGKHLARPPRWLATDPLDSLLGIAARDPEAAERFLDPGPDDKNDRLQYLVHDRDWKTRYELTGNYSHPDADQLRKVEDPNARKGLASAIEAATTGHRTEDRAPMGAAHTEGQARVMQSTIGALNGKFGDKLPENLRSPIARAIVDYTPDTHEILTGQNPRYGYEGGLKKPWSGEGGSHLAVDQQSLVRVMRGVSDDPKNFSLIYNAERAHSADVLAGMPARPGGANTDWNVPSRDVGMAFGTLNAIGADVIMDTQDARKTWADDVARYGYHLGGAPVTGLPIIGDAAQRTIDAAAYDWSKDIKNLADEKARGDLAKDWTKDTASVKDLIDASAKTRHIDPMEPRDTHYNDVKQMRQEAEQSYAAGRNKALTYLRPN
ncbi:hypothetical protein [Streptomyces roseoverticillatus]|uniref:Uncharacterized protein n=1 Tax=Streptomyces roseoverticillatus TaxID=66429 RepID=A0ABV3J003_9ACTN